jgi:hypothetical protein
LTWLIAYVGQEVVGDNFVRFSLPLHWKIDGSWNSNFANFIFGRNQNCTASSVGIKLLWLFVLGQIDNRNIF